jgi:hypothetical protein
MICPKAKECASGLRGYTRCCAVPHERNSACSLGCGPKQHKSCIPYIPEQPKKPATCQDCNGTGINPDKFPDARCPCTYPPADLKPAESTIKCPFFKNGKCTKPLDTTAECNNCGKPAETCALTCDCEEETCNIGTVVEPLAEPQAKMPLTNEEEILYDAILSARKVQEFLWGENNSDWDIDEWRAMFQKRWVKIASIEPANPHGIIELKKRLLQNAALCLALLSILEQKKPVKTTNLPQYRGVKYDI